MKPWTGLVCLRIWYLLRRSMLSATNELPATETNLSLCKNNEHGTCTTNEQRFLHTCQHQLSPKQFYEAVSKHPQALPHLANAGYILRCYSNRLLAFISQAKVFGLENNFRTPTLSGYFRFRIHELMEEKHQRRDRMPSHEVLELCNAILIEILKNWSGSANDGPIMNLRGDEVRFWSTNAKFYQNFEEKLRAFASNFNRFELMQVERNVQDGMVQLAGGGSVRDDAGQFIGLGFERTYAGPQSLKKHGCKFNGQYTVSTQCTETNSALRKCNERVNKLVWAGTGKVLRSNDTKFVSLANPDVPIKNSDRCTRGRTASDHQRVPGPSQRLAKHVARSTPASDHQRVPGPSQRLAKHAARSTPATAEQTHLAIAWAAPDGITGDDPLCAEPAKPFTYPNQDGRSNVNDRAESINTNACPRVVSKAEHLHSLHRHVPPSYFIITHQIILHYTFKTYVRPPGDDDGIAAVTVAEPTETAGLDGHIKSDDSGECLNERTVSRCSSLHDQARAEITPGTVYERTVSRCSSLHDQARAEVTPGTVYERTVSRHNSLHDQARAEVTPGTTAPSVHASVVPECFSERENFFSVCSTDAGMAHWHDASKSILGEWPKSLEEIAHGPPLSGLTCAIVALRTAPSHLGTNQADKDAQRAVVAKFEFYREHPMHAGVALEMYGLVGCSGRSLDRMPPMDQGMVSFMEKCINEGYRASNCSDCTLCIGHIPATDVSSTLRGAVRSGSKYHSMVCGESARNESFQHPSDNLGVFCAILRIVAPNPQLSRTNVGHSLADRGGMPDPVPRATHESINALESRDTHGYSECGGWVAVHQAINSANDLCDKACTAESEAGGALAGLHAEKRSSGGITGVPCLLATDNEEGPAHHGKEKDKDSDHSCGSMTGNNSDSEDGSPSPAEYTGVHADDPLAEKKHNQCQDDCTTKRCSEPTPHATFNGIGAARAAQVNKNGALRQRLGARNTLRDDCRPQNVVRSNAQVLKERVESTPPVPGPCEHSTSYEDYVVKNGHRLRKDANPLVPRNKGKCDTLSPTEHGEVMGNENDVPSRIGHGNGTVGRHRSDLHGVVPEDKTVRRAVGCDPRKITKILSRASCKEIGPCVANATSGNEEDCHCNPSTNHVQRKHRLVLRGAAVDHAQKRSTCQDLPITDLEGHVPDESGKRAQTVHKRLPVATSCGSRASGSNPSRDSRRESATLHATRARSCFGTECSCDYHLSGPEKLSCSSGFSYGNEEEALWHCNTSSCWCRNEGYPCTDGGEAFVRCKTCSDKRYAQLFCPCNFDAQAHRYSGCNEPEETERSQSTAEQSENGSSFARMSDKQGKNDESYARRNGLFMTVLLALITFVGACLLISMMYWVL